VTSATGRDQASAPRGPVHQRPWTGEAQLAAAYALSRPAPKRRRWLHVLAYPAVLIAGVVIGSLGAGSPGTAAASSPTADKATVTVSAPAGSADARPAKPADPATSLGDGTYLVGDDIEPGGYTTQAGPGAGCYWARLRDTNGAFGSVITSGNVVTRTTVAVERTDAAFEASGGCTWTKR
jgi:hypothetical protein